MATTAPFDLNEVLSTLAPTLLDVTTAPTARDDHDTYDVTSTSKVFVGNVIKLDATDTASEADTDADGNNINSGMRIKQFYAANGATITPGQTYENDGVSISVNSAGSYQLQVGDDHLQRLGTGSEVVSYRYLLEQLNTTGVLVGASYATLYVTLNGDGSAAVNGQNESESLPLNTGNVISSIDPNEKVSDLAASNADFTRAPTARDDHDSYTVNADTKRVIGNVIKVDASDSASEGDTDGSGDLNSSMRINNFLDASGATLFPGQEFTKDGVTITINEAGSYQIEVDDNRLARIGTGSEVLSYSYTLEQRDASGQHATGFSNATLYVTLNGSGVNEQSQVQETLQITTPPLASIDPNEKVSDLAASNADFTRAPTARDDHDSYTVNLNTKRVIGNVIKVDATDSASEGDTDGSGDLNSSMRIANFLDVSGATIRPGQEFTKDGVTININSAGSYQIDVDDSRLARIGTGSEVLSYRYQLDQSDGNGRYTGWSSATLYVTLNGTGVEQTGASSVPVVEATPPIGSIPPEPIVGGTVPTQTPQTGGGMLNAPPVHLTDDSDSVVSKDSDLNRAVGNVLTGVGTAAGVDSADTATNGALTVVGIMPEGLMDAGYRPTFNAPQNYNISINSEGQYTFQANEMLTNRLGTGSTTFNFSYMVADSTNHYSYAKLTITVYGEQATREADKPWAEDDHDILNAGNYNVKSAIGNVILGEEGSPDGWDTDGQGFVDPLLSVVSMRYLGPTTAELRDANAGVGGPQGSTMTFNSDGSYNFDMSDSYRQSLGTNSAVVGYEYQVRNGEGHFSTATLYISVLGDGGIRQSNDQDSLYSIDGSKEASGNVITGVGMDSATADTVGENKTLSVIGYKNSDGVEHDAGSAGAFSNADYSFSINSDGQYNLVASEQLVHSLGTGSRVQSFTYYLQDSDGYTDEATLAVTIYGDQVTRNLDPQGGLMDGEEGGNGGLPTPQGPEGTATQAPVVTARDDHDSFGKGVKSLAGNVITADESDSANERDTNRAGGTDNLFVSSFSMISATSSGTADALSVRSGAVFVGGMVGSGGVQDHLIDFSNGSKIEMNSRGQYTFTASDSYINALGTNTAVLSFSYDVEEKVQITPPPGSDYAYPTPRYETMGRSNKATLYVTVNAEATAVETQGGTPPPGATGGTGGDANLITPPPSGQAITARDDHDVANAGGFVKNRAIGNVIKVDRSDSLNEGDTNVNGTNAGLYIDNFRLVGQTLLENQSVIDGISYGSIPTRHSPTEGGSVTLLNGSVFQIDTVGNYSFTASDSYLHSLGSNSGVLTFEYSLTNQPYVSEASQGVMNTILTTQNNVPLHSTATLYITVRGDGNIVTRNDADTLDGDVTTTALGNVLSGAGMASGLASADSGALVGESNTPTNLRVVGYKALTGGRGSAEQDVGTPFENSDYTFRISSNGEYTLNANETYLNNLGSNTQVVSFQYFVSDGTYTSQATLAVTIQGKYDETSSLVDDNGDRTPVSTVSPNFPGAGTGPAAITQNDEAAVSVGATGASVRTLGNVLSNDFNKIGDDSNHQLQVSGVGDTQMTSGSLAVNGQYGRLVMTKGGSYIYEANGTPPDGVSTETFVYSVSNATTGGVATATLTVTVVNQASGAAAGGVLHASDDHITIRDGFAVNTYQDGTATSVLSNDQGAEQVVGVNGMTDISEPIQGRYGKLLMDEFGHYNYTQNEGWHAKQATVDQFTYTVKGFDDQLETKTLFITIQPENYQASSSTDLDMASLLNSQKAAHGRPGVDTYFSEGEHTNTFKWSQDDLANDRRVDIDVIYGFKERSLSDGSQLFVEHGSSTTGMGDRLDLKDLLKVDLKRSVDGMQESEELTKYLHFEQKGDDTIVQISTSGRAQDAGIAHDDLHIVLKDVNLTQHGSETMSDQMIIQDLLNRNKLIID